MKVRLKSQPCVNAPHNDVPIPDQIPSDGRGSSWTDVPWQSPAYLLSIQNGHMGAAVCQSDGTAIPGGGGG